MDLSIIIPTKDRGEVFYETLYGVVNAIEGLRAEIIVVNDSKISSLIIPDAFNNVRLIDNPKKGVASARNLGASLAKSELIIFIDDDILISKQSITKTIDRALSNPFKIYIFNWVYPLDTEKYLTKFQFGRYLIKFGFTSLKGWLDGEWFDDEVFELKGGNSQFLPMKKSLFAEIGGYNESFPHAGAEDYDFIYRAKEKGVKFYLDKSCTIYHNEKDRLNILNWLNRKKRNGETLKIGFKQGYHELAINYRGLKSLVLFIFSKIKFLFFITLKVIPNIPFFDPIYFRFTNTLLAIYIYEGYTKNNEGK